MSVLRIVSLLASATEIVHALGLGEFQVGRSHECDYPPSVLDLPVCSRPAIPVDGSSAEIDQHVKSRVASALSIYEVDAARVRQLHPSHILTQTQCKVCAVSLEDVERDLRASLASGVCVVSLEPYALADLWRDIRHVADACGVSDAGERLNARLQEQMHFIAQIASQASRRPRVAAIEWIEPLMAAGNWVPELIEMAGAQNLFGEAGAHSPWMSWDQLRAADPDVLVILPCGFNLARTQSEMHCLTAHPHWAELRAVRAGNVFLCDGNQYMNRSGPRLTDSLRIFAEIFHPDLFPPSFETGGWLRFATR